MLWRPYVYVSLSYSFCQNKNLKLLFKVNCKHVAAYTTTMAPQPPSAGPDIWLLLVKSSFQANNLHF